jgi:succinoglycan biosynthesis protein ExoL
VEKNNVEGAARLVFFTQDITDICTARRVEQFLDHGLSPIVLGFWRGRYNRDFRPSWPHVVLGVTRDAAYWQRMRAMLRAIPIAIANRRYLRGAAVFYARNFDQLILALLLRRACNLQAAVVYEILDIQPVFVGRGLVPALLRALERFCLRRIRLLVLSSPAFHQHYFAARQSYAGAWLLLENKIHRSVLRHMAEDARARTYAAPNGHRWVVGYFGLIRGEATIALMTRLAARLRDRVMFQFRGVFTTVDEARFRAALAANPNMTYDGEYANPRDLGQMYGGVDFAWAIDLENVEHNSRWLRPCRFYEAGLFGVPCLAARDFEVGRLVDSLAVGWTFGEPIEEALVRFFESLTLADYAAKRRALATLPIDRFVAGEDGAELCRALTGSASTMINAAQDRIELGAGVLPTASNALDAKRYLRARTS